MAACGLYSLVGARGSCPYRLEIENIPKELTSYETKHFNGLVKMSPEDIQKTRTKFITAVPDSAFPKSGAGLEKINTPLKT